MSLLRCRRAVALAFVLPSFFLRLALMRLRGPLTPERRAHWLQACCYRVVSVLGMEVRFEGLPPARGLLVSNHLSYLDIAVYASIVPCVFVSRSDVAAWPYFGPASRAAGTIFLDRASHASALEAGAAMRARLAGAVPVLLFPEGTSTDGARVQRFHSSLFEPAVAAGAAVTAAAIRYELAEGTPEREACWFGDAGFAPHLWKLLALPGVSAKVHFAPAQRFDDRRAAARSTHDVVQGLRASAAVVI
ncbi:MAG: lysophospholipid acyltransferase family protein [Acidobacteriota bacterium]